MCVTQFDQHIFHVYHFMTLQCLLPNTDQCIYLRFIINSLTNDVEDIVRQNKCILVGLVTVDFA